MGEQIVLLFTSTKKALYKRDLLNVCCQNLGSYVEFAYQDDWVSDSVRKNVQAIQGREALIVFVEDVPPDEAGSPDAIPKRFHPLRWATIVEATKDPEGISLSLQLGKFEEFEKDPSARVQLFGQYALAGEHRPAGQRPKFVRTEASWTPSKRTEDRIALINHVRTLNGLDDALYFWPEGTTILERRQPISKAATHERVDAGEHFMLSLRIVAGRRATASLPTFTASHDVVRVVGPITRQASHGIVAQYEVNALPQFQPHRTLVSVRAGDRPDECISPVYSQVVESRPNSWKKWVAVLLFAGGPIVATITQPIVVDQVEVVPAAAWKIVGFILTLVGGIVAFRRLKIG